eukprot:9184509-Alexandrium_andersonii.AAC.1
MSPVAAGGYESSPPVATSDAVTAQGLPGVRESPAGMDITGPSGANVSGMTASASEGDRKGQGE